MTKLPFGYHPRGWNDDLTAQDYLSHIGAEFDRLSIDPYQDLLQFTEVWRSLRLIQPNAHSGIQRYIDRAREEVRAKTGQSLASNDLGFRICFGLNQIGNFTMTWDPDEETFERFGIRADHSLPIGWSRHRNELVYIKEFHDLLFPIDDKILRGATRIPTTSECLASDLLCCSRKWIEQVIVEIQSITKAAVDSAFRFSLEDKPLWTSPTIVENLVVDWEIEQF